MGSWEVAPGLNHVGAYQSSGQPYAKGEIDATSATVVGFPQVTRWIYVVNTAATPLRVGFSEAGVDGSNYFTVDASSSNGYGTSERLELKISQLWLSGSNSVDVLAGLTAIPGGRANTDDGPSWSGSAGVG